MKTFDRFSSGEEVRGIAILQDYLAGEDHKPFLSRLLLGADGVYRLAVQRPAVQSTALHPWQAGVGYQPSEAQWFEAETVAMDIPAALALLRSADPNVNCELVISARRRAAADEAERLRIQKEANEKAQAERQADNAARAQHREVALRGKAWDAKAGWVRNNYRLAHIFESNGMAQIAREIRALAAETPRFVPGASRRWHWPGDHQPRSYEEATATAIDEAIKEGPTDPVEGWWRP
jgi:hypothetical protein